MTTDVHNPSPSADLPHDHGARLDRAFHSLTGLAIGDAIGEMLSYRHSEAPHCIREGLPAGPWFHTDDTEMPLSVVDVIATFGTIDQNALAGRFAWRFERDPDRGYGKMTRIQMREILAGADWRDGAASAFSGQGSLGNGGAMRVTPLGAYFGDDLERAADEGRLSSLVTHTHPEGVAGTIAVAVAAAAAFQFRDLESEERAPRLFEEVLKRTPKSEVREGLSLAARLESGTTANDASRALGNGSLITAPDTVPFAIWCAVHFLDDFVEAISQTISVGGDCDTNAAIVGGIVASCSEIDVIPTEWRESCEALARPSRSELNP